MSFYSDPKYPLILGTCLFFIKYYPYGSVASDEFIATVMIFCASFIGVPIAIFRYYKTTRLVYDGVVIPASVIYIDEFIKPWFAIRYKFNYDGASYVKTRVYIYSIRTKHLANKKDVVILFNPSNGWSHIRDVFLGVSGFKPPTV